MLPDLLPLRQAQILTALEQAVLLRPDLDRAHALLAQLYYEQGQLDRCLDHLRARLRIAEQDTERRAALQPDVEKMEELVSQSEKTYQANLAGKTDPSKVLERAHLAARYGLSRRRWSCCWQSYPAIFGKSGVEYELDLMLQAGQSYEVRDMAGAEARSTDRLFHVSLGKGPRRGELRGLCRSGRGVGKGSEPLRQILASCWCRCVRRWPFKSREPCWPARPLCELAALFSTAGIASLGGAGRTAASASRPAGASRSFGCGIRSGGGGSATFPRRPGRVGQRERGRGGRGLDFPARPIAQQMIRRLQE